MTYPTAFTPTQTIILGQIVPQLEQLKPNQTAIISCASESAARQHKYLLYAWLSPLHSNKKEIYRIKTIDAKKFIILRIDDRAAKVTIEENECQAFVMQHLLDIDSEVLAIEAIDAYCDDPAKKVRILDEWRRKQ